MNAVLIQHCWPDAGILGNYLPLFELTEERNKAYCSKHNFDFLSVIGTVKPEYEDRKDGNWPKVELIRQALEKNYEYIIWLDPDALIYDDSADLRNGCPPGIGACWHRIPQLNHWNTGVLYMRNTQEVKDFVDEWLAAFPGDLQWKEQGAFNKLAMTNKVVETISDRWNATVNYSMVPDAVVLGYHGNGDANLRLAMMQETLKKLEAK